VLLHVFGHVDADHRRLTIEERFRERLRELGFSYAGWSEERKLPTGRRGSLMPAPSLKMRR